MPAYYNENDPKAAAWLRELIKAKAIAPGEVDERSIEDVTLNDLRGFKQHHFFAGIGVWSYALRLAGWPDDVPVWTGSCPCQPFSAAGKGSGVADERHLWPAWFHLIDLARPPVVFGEQVASPAGLMWLDTVQADMEGAGYAIGAADLCAASVGAPHIRQRLYFVADSMRQSSEWRTGSVPRAQASEHSQRLVNGSQPDGFEHGGETGLLAHSNGGHTGTEWEQRGGQQRLEPQNGSAGELGHSGGPGLSQQRCDRGLSRGQVEPPEGQSPERTGASAISDPGYSLDFGARNQDTTWVSDWIFCRDSKWRPVEPGSFPLAHGTPARVGRLRGYGNAIVAPLAAAFIESYMTLEIAA